MIRFLDQYKIYQLAKIHFSLGDYNQAKEYVVEAKKTNPENIWYSYLLIEIYYQTFEIEKQAEVWLDLIQIDKENPLYYLEAIHTYMNLGLFKKALKILKLLIIVKPILQAIAI